MNHQDTWAKNVEAKVNEVLAACRNLITKEVPQNQNALEFRKACYECVNEELRSLSSMFGKDLQPPEIEKLRSHASHFIHNREHRAAFANVLASMNKLTAIFSTESQLISMHDIFENHKSDEELNELIDHLISALEKVIEEGDAHMTARVERDLQRLLEQIKGRSRLSIFEIGALAEVIGRMALEFAGQKMGFPAGSMLMDVAKASWKVRERVIRNFQDGQNEFIRLLEIKSVEADLSQLPDLDDGTILMIENRLVGQGFEVTTAPQSSPSTADTRPPASEPAEPTSP
jgi:hypothetical protein